VAAELNSAWTTFRKLLPPEFFDPFDPAPAQTLYTPWVVTWLVIYQRLDGNATLNEAVDEFKFRFPQPALPDCQRAANRDFSSNSGAYSSARQRLELQTACAVADHVYDTLIGTVPPFLAERRCFIVDGSSILLASTPALREAFPGATNQHGQSHWPVLHIAVAHELTCGLAVRPEYGPMYGPEAVGEITLARRLMARLPERSILMGDQNFGIFIFAWTADQMGHTALLRLTKKRFTAMVKRATRVGPGRWKFTWRPSRDERKKYPELPADANVDGYFIQKEYEHPTKGKMKLYLFVTEDLSNEQAAAIYSQRLCVETDIRDLKCTLLVSDLHGKSVPMVEKELVLATVAFNLVNQTRRLAAKRAGVEPRRISFTGVWSLLKTVSLCLLCECDIEDWQKEFDRVLDAAGQRKLPKRKKGREYPRQVHMKRRNFPPRKSSQPESGEQTQTAQTALATI
jgi:hypothetical protein